MIRLALAALIAAQSTSAALPDEMLLQCQGVMRGNWKAGSAGAFITGPNGEWQSGSGSLMRYGEVPTIAELRIKKGQAKLLLPQPPSCGICSGENGWRDVKGFTVTGESFSGKIQYGLFSGTEFEIDRRTGRMTSKNGFEGECRSMDLTERKF